LGGYAVGNPTLNRFFSLHYLLPFVIAAWSCCTSGRCTSRARTIRPASNRRPKRTRAFHAPWTSGSVGHVLLHAVLRMVLFYMPNYLGDADNYIPANPGVDARAHREEWYYLPFYAILRSIPNKLAGVVGMFGAILILAFLPWLDNAKTRSSKYRPLQSSSSGSSSWSASGSAISARAAGRHLVIAGRILTVLYLRLFPDPAAVAEPDRDAAAGAEFDRRRRAGSMGQVASAIVAFVVAGGLLVGGRAGMLAPTTTASAARNKWSFSGPMGQVRSRFAAARPEGLQGSLFVLPRSVLHRLLAPRRSARSRLFGASGRSVRFRLQDQGRSGRQGRDVRAAGPAAGLLPVAVPNENAARAPMAARRRRPVVLITKARSYKRGFPMFPG